MQDTVSVSIVGSESLRVEPGDVVTLAFRSEQSGSESIMLSPHIDLPDGWRSLRPQESITVRPGSPVVRLVSIHVPEGYHAGTYPFTFSITNANRPEISSRVTASVTVTMQYGILLEIDQPPAFVAAGKTVRSQLSVLNTGNTPARVALSWDGSQGGIIELDTHEILLEPGHSESVPVSLVTDSDVAEVTTVSYRVSANVVNVPQTETRVSIRTDIIPIFKKLAMRGTPVPLALTVEAVGNNRGTHPVARISTGFEALDGNVEVVGTLADNSSGGLYDARDELRVSYVSEKVDVTVGDHPQNLSPLTVWGMYRMGASSRIRFDKWDMSLLGSRSRSFAPEDALAGLSVRHQISSVSSVSTNLLVRQGLYTGVVATLAYDWAPPGSRQSIAAECGLSGAERLADPSCRLESALTRGPVRSRIEAQSTANSLPGARSGIRLLSESVRIRLWPGLQLEESFQIQRRGANTGSERVSHAANVGLTYSRRFSGTTWTSTVQGMRDVLSLRSPSQRLSAASRLLRVTTGLQRSRFGVTLTREIGRRLDAHVASAPVGRSRIQARMTPIRWLSLSMSADRYSDFLISSRLRQQSSQYGIRAGLNLPSNVQVSLGGVQNHVSGRSKQEYRSLTFQASKQFESGSRAFVQSQASMSEGRSDVRRIEFRMGVTMPLGIPSPRSIDTSGQFVNGHVYHMVTGVPAEGVVIRYGEHLVITNRDGEFRLPRTDNASWYLEVNQVSLPEGTVPVLEMPYLVGPDILTVDIPIVASGVVEGHVVRLGAPGNPGLLYNREDHDLIEKEHIPGALLELRSETKSLRTRSDRYGAFTFRGMPEGAYTLRVVSVERLPAYHEFRADEYDIVVQRDSVISIRFEAVPVKRTIRFQKTGQSRSLQLGIPQKKPRAVPPRQATEIPGLPDSLSRAAIVPPAPKAPPSGNPPVSETPTGESLSTEPPAMESSIVESLAAASSPEKSPLVQSLNRQVRSSIMALLLILSILSYLLATDLMLRHVVGKRHTQLGNISNLRDQTLWHYRQCALYGLVLSGVVASMGPLAGVSAALGLSAISIIIESWTTVQVLVSIVKLRILLAARSRFVVLYHGVIVDNITLERNSALFSLKTGQSIVLSPMAAIGPAVTYLWGAHAIDISIPILRSANLLAVREDVNAFMHTQLHADAADSLHVAWGDVNTETTLVHVSAVTDRTATSASIARHLTDLLSPYAASGASTLYHLPLRAA